MTVIDGAEEYKAKDRKNVTPIITFWLNNRQVIEQNIYVSHGCAGNLENSAHLKQCSAGSKRIKKKKKKKKKKKLHATSKLTILILLIFLHVHVFERKNTNF